MAYRFRVDDAAADRLDDQGWKTHGTNTVDVSLVLPEFLLAASITSRITALAIGTGTAWPVCLRIWLRRPECHCLETLGTVIALRVPICVPRPQGGDYNRHLPVVRRSKGKRK